MECDAAGANIYHITVCGDTFNFFIFSDFSSQLSISIAEGRAVAILMIKYVLRVQWIST